MQEGRQRRAVGWGERRGGVYRRPRCHRKRRLAEVQLQGLTGAGPNNGQAWMPIFTSLLRKHPAQVF